MKVREKRIQGKIAIFLMLLGHREIFSVANFCSIHDLCRRQNNEYELYWFGFKLSGPHRFNSSFTVLSQWADLNPSKLCVADGYQPHSQTAIKIKRMMEHKSCFSVFQLILFMTYFYGTRNVDIMHRSISSEWKQNF